MASTKDLIEATLAFGFTLGFGFLTVWEAIKQTKRNKNPLRSAYIYMIWGEIAASLIFAILAWLLLNGTLSESAPVYFFILFCWVFQIQLLMQIIINRIAIISETQENIWRLKLGVATVITIINICVFAIFIPAHIKPPVSQLFVDINEYWDRTSKFLILSVDAGLNYYFVMCVKKRLLEQAGLVKYQPLVSFNAKLLVLSVSMDALLIGLMWLPNHLVFLCFHPVTYTVKLNIEMSMASMILRLASNNRMDATIHDEFNSHEIEIEHGHNSNSQCRWSRSMQPPDQNGRTVALKTFTRSRIEATGQDPRESEDSTPTGIQKRMEVKVTHENHDPHDPSLAHRSSRTDMNGRTSDEAGDDVSIEFKTGPPRPFYDQA